MTLLLDVQGLTRDFRVRNSSPWARKTLFRAVDDVSFTLASGETLGLVGESGSGKSTIAKLISRQIELTQGTVRFASSGAVGQEGRGARHGDLQTVFQDASGALDPRWPIWRHVDEPLQLQRGGTRRLRREMVDEALREVGLGAEHRDRLPNELSGGQRQRVVIARALILKPKLVICDEAVSALDVSVQAQILNLLRRLQQERGAAYLFISHDLRVVRHISHRIAVLYRGRLVEIGPAAEVFERPRHPYTQALIASIPQLDPRMRHHRRRSQGTAPGRNAPDGGCCFRSHCSFAASACAAVPPMVGVAPGGAAACWRLAGDQVCAA